ncbi:hypothetical protein B0J12DRAFT_674663 [Macrophomina phaseolina]|uniref:Uncharacterized protein n=1 Tax=Macrophomina phaseolina TaxID=35725 RepID=A0ABQ8G1D3_9PEZI|nr:hypothetical protein B0J12DRAFT_674663 [Macrophomina phaseolina]
MPPLAKAAAREAARLTPSRLHIALAIAVIQSKPSELTVPDYLGRLREHVRVGRGVHDEGTSTRRLDSASYWARRFEDAEAAQTQLEAKVTEYEREIERLRSELLSGQKAGITQALPTARKRKDAPSPGPPSHPSKKLRLGNDTSGAHPMGTVEDTLPEGLDVLSAASEVGSRVVQHLYQAHKSYNHTENTGRSLAYHLVQASDLLGPLLTSACNRHQQRTSSAPGSLRRNAKTAALVPGPVLAGYDNEIVSIFEAAARIFLALAYGLKELGSQQPTSDECGAVIYSLVGMFSHLLKTLEKLASSHASNEAAAAQNPRQKRQMATRQTQKIITNPQPVSLVIRLLSNFLANVLTVSSTNESHHPELLEGFLFVLFRRLGSCVYFCTFGHQKHGNVEEDIAAWTDPAEFEDTPAYVRKKIGQRALELELPILITLLERGLAAAQHHVAPFGTPASRKQSKAFAAKPGAKMSVSSLKSGLSLAARKKLEQSLAHSIFGVESDGDEMAECLAMPVRQALMEPPQKVKEEDIKSWFVEKVWALVGWEAVLDMR